MFENEDEENWFWLIALGAVATMFGGAWFAPLLEPVRTWALNTRLVTTEATIIDLPGGVGFDLPRLLIIIGVLALFVALAVFWVIARVRARQEKSRLEGQVPA
ncbi:hypothetical protein [Agromyces bauzanensis]